MLTHMDAGLSDALFAGAALQVFEMERTVKTMVVLQLVMVVDLIRQHLHKVFGRVTRLHF